MSHNGSGLTLVSGPIGNLKDLSPRAAEALEQAEVWFVEDTRVSGKLQSHLGIKRPMRVCSDHTGEAVLEKLADEAAEKPCALLSDAGTPGISDPGARLVDICYERGIPVDSIPGPSAVTDALALSGFYAQRFAFLGFPPRKRGPMLELLSPFADSALTLVLFESPHRVARLLEWGAEALGDRRCAICRELTKAHQQIYRCRLSEPPTESQVPRKGEVTVVIEGLRRRQTSDDNV